MKNGLVLLMVAAVLFLPGCSAIGPEPEQLMVPPRLSGENKNLQDALERAIGAKITFKFPKNENGNGNRSAFLLINPENGDAENEKAVAFYATKEENAVTHIHFLEKVEGVWRSIDDVSGAGNDIDWVLLTDLDNSGSQQLITGWSAAGTGRENRIAVYSFAGNELKKLLNDSYTEYFLQDMDRDGNREILLLHLDAAQKTSTAKLYQYKNNEINLMGSAELDGEVTGYGKVELHRVEKNMMGLYIDAYKASSEFSDADAPLAMITELIFWDGNTLCAPLNAALTYRVYPYNYMDIDGDGLIEIPVLNELPGQSERPVSKRIWFVDFKQYTGDRFATKLTVVINNVEGYYFELPADWRNTVTIRENRLERTWHFVAYDGEKSPKEEDFFRIRSFAKAEWDKEKPEDFFFVGSAGETVFAGRISAQKGSPEIAQKDAVSGFHLWGK